MILATLYNMRKYAAANVVAYSPATEEVFSAHPDDYFDMATDDYLEDSEGYGMVLAYRIPEHFKPLEAA